MRNALASDVWSSLVEEYLSTRKIKASSGKPLAVAR